MGKLDDFLAPQNGEGQARPEGLEWFASVQCQVCNTQVNQQTLYPADQLLVWECGLGHRSFIEGYTAF